MPNVLERLPEAETGEICVDWSSISPATAIVDPEQTSLAGLQNPRFSFKQTISGARLTVFKRSLDAILDAARL